MSHSAVSQAAAISVSIGNECSLRRSIFKNNSISFNNKSWSSSLALNQKTSNLRDFVYFTRRQAVSTVSNSSRYVSVRSNHRKSGGLRPAASIRRVSLMALMGRCIQWPWNFINLESFNTVYSI